ELVRMLAPATCDHTADGFAFLEERAVAELLTTVPRNHVLDEHFIGSRERARTTEHETKLCARVDPPSFSLCCVEEVFLDSGFQNEGKRAVDLIERFLCERKPRLREGNVQMLCELIGLALVEHPLDGIPFRHGDTECLRKNGAVASERGHDFIARRKKDPALKIEGATNTQERLYSGLFLTQIGN